MNSTHLLKETTPINVSCDTCTEEITTGMTYIANLETVTIHCETCADRLGLTQACKSQEEINNILNNRLMKLIPNNNYV